MGNRFAFIANDYEQKYGQPFNNLLSSGGSYGNYGNYGSNYNSGNSSGSIFKNPALAGAMITAGASIFTAALPSIINAFANNNSSKDADNSGNATGTATGFTDTTADTQKLIDSYNKAQAKAGEKTEGKKADTAKILKGQLESRKSALELQKADLDKKYSAAKSEFDNANKELGVAEERKKRLDVSVPKAFDMKVEKNKLWNNIKDAITNLRLEIAGLEGLVAIANSNDNEAGTVLEARKNKLKTKEAEEQKAKADFENAEKLWKEQAEELKKLVDETIPDYEKVVNAKEYDTISKQILSVENQITEIGNALGTTVSTVEPVTSSSSSNQTVEATTPTSPAPSSQDIPRKLKPWE